MASTSTDIANMALRRIGAKEVTDITSTTEKGAVIANTFYSDTLKEVSRMHPWNCLKRRATLKLYGKEPAFEWGYRYALPSDYLRLERLNGTNTWEPQDFYEIEGFYDNLVTNGTFVDEIDDWTTLDVSPGVSSHNISDALSFVNSTGTSGRSQTVHTMVGEDHVVTINVSSNFGSAVIDVEMYADDDTDEDTNLVPLLSQATSAGFTGAHTFTLNNPTTRGTVLKVSSSTASGTVSFSSITVTCATAPNHVLLTDADSARVSYIASRTTVTEFDQEFVEVLILALAHKCSVAMRQDNDLSQAVYAEYQAKLSAARKTDGGEQGRRQYDLAGGSRWVNSRWRSTNG